MGLHSGRCWHSKDRRHGTGVASAPIELAIDICSLAGPATGEAGRSSLFAAVKLPPPPPLPPSPRPTLAPLSRTASAISQPSRRDAAAAVSEPLHMCTLPSRQGADERSGALP